MYYLPRPPNGPNEPRALATSSHGPSGTMVPFGSYGRSNEPRPAQPPRVGPDVSGSPQSGATATAPPTEMTMATAVTGKTATNLRRSGTAAPRTRGRMVANSTFQPRRCSNTPPAQAPHRRDPRNLDIGSSRRLSGYPGAAP